MRGVPVTMYVADDGREFRDKARCEQYERDCAAVAGVLTQLHPRPVLPACGFENGAGYVQQPVNGDQLWAQIRALPGAEHPRDAGEPWSGAYHRAMCIDACGREWGQPYFATHPREAKQVDLTSTVEAPHA